MTPEGIAIIGAVSTVIAGFGGAALGAFFSYKSGIKLIQKAHANDINLMRQQEFSRAVATFRTKLHSIVEGYYPDIHSWNEADYAMIQDTIPKVQSIASDFSFYLQGEAIGGFNAAVQKYCQYCKNISKSHDSANARYPSMRKTDGSEIFNKENFSRHIDYLFLFAKEK